MREQVSNLMFTVRCWLIARLAGQSPILMNLDVYRGKNDWAIFIENGCKKSFISGCRIFDDEEGEGSIVLSAHRLPQTQVAP